MKVRDVIKVIEKDGWTHNRTRGDHRVYIHPTKPGIVVFLVMLAPILRPGHFRVS